MNVQGRILMETMTLVSHSGLSNLGLGCHVFFGCGLESWAHAASWSSARL